MKITAQVSADPQHGPVVTVCVDDVRVSVYLADETGIVTTPDGQHGVAVAGPWHAMRDQLAVMSSLREHTGKCPATDAPCTQGCAGTLCDGLPPSGG